MTRKRLLHRPSSRGRLAVRLLVLAGALAGLFAMHGLGDHGASSHDMGARTSPVVATSHASHTAHDARSATEGAWTVDDAPGEDSPGMAMAGLCLAVLAGAIIGFLLLRPLRTLVVMRPIAPAFVPARPSRRRDRDPPCPFELSVLRT